MNEHEPLGAANLIGLLFLGAALLWTLKLIYAGRRGQRDWLRRVLNLVGIVMSLLGGVGLVASIAGGGATILVLVGGAILLMAVRQYRAAERRALLLSLASAADKGLPLPAAVRLFADRRGDEVGDRFDRLADLLEGGVTLPWAFERSGNRLDSVTRAAVDLGEQTGALGPVLRKSLMQVEEMELAQRRIFEMYLYLAFVVLVTCGPVSFFVWRVLPTIAEMFDEFELELPRNTQLAIQISEWLASWPFVPVAVILGSWLTIMLLVIKYLNLWPGELFGLDRLSITNDRAAVLRALALTVRAGRPLAEAVRVLSWRYPKRVIRSRLERASKQIDAGGEWRAALAQAGIITKAEAALFAASEKVGNLAWTMEEMAAGAQRRLILRMRAALGVIFPVVILSCAAIVAFVATAVFVPLVALIQGLS